MTPKHIKQARLALGLRTLDEAAPMFAYTGEHARSSWLEIEAGRRGKTLRDCQRRLMAAYLSGYRPDDWTATGDEDKAAQAALLPHFLPDDAA